MNIYDATEQAYKNGYTDGMKEFADRLKDKHYYSQQIGALVVDLRDIYNLMKEMEEDMIEKG